MKLLKCIFFITCLTIGNISPASAKEYNETQIRNITSFNAIKVSTGIDLYLKQGNQQKVKIVTDRKNMNNVKTEIKDGILHVYMKKKLV